MKLFAYCELQKKPQWNIDFYIFKVIPDDRYLEKRPHVHGDNSISDQFQPTDLKFNLWVEEFNEYPSKLVQIFLP